MAKTFEDFEKRVLKNNKSKIDSVLEVSKKDLLNPAFMQFLEKHKNFVQIDCVSKEFYFSKQEIKKLIQIDRKLKKNNKNNLSSGLVFTLKINSYADVFLGQSAQSLGKFQETLYKCDCVFALKKHSLEDVLKVNHILQNVADKINNAKILQNGKYRSISPFEKFLVCSDIIAKSIQYNFNEENSTESQDYISAIIQLNGCCLAQAMSLSVLLKMVGIKASTVAAAVGFKNWKKKNEGFPALTARNAYQDYKTIQLLSRGNKKLFDLAYLFSTDNIYSYSNKILNKTVLTKNNYDFKSNLGFSQIGDHYQTLVGLEDKRYNINGAFVCDVTNLAPFALNKSMPFSYISLKDYFAFFRPINLASWKEEGLDILKTIGFNKRLMESNKFFKKTKQAEFKTLNQIYNSAKDYNKIICGLLDSNDERNFNVQDRALMATVSAALQTAGRCSKDITINDWNKAAKVVSNNLPKIFKNKNYLGRKTENKTKEVIKEF
ncbi:MAG: hypothetical protein J5779_02210 [Clostridia bacterium]|nr:hypothetical protein [Clostridia bacterium]